MMNKITKEKYKDVAEVEADRDRYKAKYIESLQNLVEMSKSAIDAQAQVKSLEARLDHQTKERLVYEKYWEEKWEDLEGEIAYLARRVWGSLR